MATERRPTGDKERMLELKRRVLELRIEAKSQRAIAEQVGVCQQRVSQLLREARTELLAKNTELVEEALALDVERIDEGLNVVMARIREERDSSQVPNLVKLIEQRAKLFGLYAPEKHAINAGEMSEDAIAAAVRDIFRFTDDGDRDGASAEADAGNDASS